MLRAMLCWFRGCRWRSRRLFRYWDGRRWRYGDPFVLWRAIVNHPTVNFENALPLVDEGQEPETSQVIAALYSIFDVAAWNEQQGTGLTQWEVLGVLGSFNEYLESLKKSTSPGPISSPPTEWTPSSASPAAPDPAESASSASGSTPSASTPDAATTSSAPSATA